MTTFVVHNYTQASKGGLYYSVKFFGEVKGNLKKPQPKPDNCKHR